MGETVLICDDDEGILEVTRLYLELEGYHVVTSKDSEGFFQVLPETNPDVVLMDIWLPKTNGDVVTEYLKNDPVFRNIPVVLFSANRDVANVAQRVGAEGYIRKPFDLNEVKKTIERVMH